MAHLLIIDDDKQICLFLTKLVGRLGHQSAAVHTAKDAIDACNTSKCDLVLLDLELPDQNGLSVLPELLKSPYRPEVIIITGTGNIKGAEIAFNHGAWDFIPKPLRSDEVILSITRALQYRDEKLVEKGFKLFSRENIIGESSALNACLELAAQAASTDTNILITGETGTGKELLSKAIHINSNRSGRPFVVVDCAALPESIIESALFGHEKGAFTGAVTHRPGMIRQAETGTLFLDEVGELPLSMQKNFLRLLQERRFRPVGSDIEIHSDFRLVAATNRDLDKLVNSGGFRQDLLYRLRSIVIEVPPLRERRSDIMQLVLHHLEQNSATENELLKGVTPEFIKILQEYDWPGNIRELLNTLDHCLAVARHTPTLHPIHLPSQIRLPFIKDQLPEDANLINALPASLYDHDELPPIRTYRDQLIKTAEKQYLTELMRRTRGNIKSACKISGLSESRLHALLKKHQTPRFRESQ